MSTAHTEPPLCLPPHSELTRADYTLPVGACDTHAHVVSPDTTQFPLSADRSYTPQPAPEGDYLRMLAAQGMTRGVLVQISVYGTDNRYMLDVLRRHPQRLRGVAVVSPDVSDAELEAMHRAGVRGVRLNVLFKGGIGFDAMVRLAHRIRDLGWHMQFLLDARQLPDLMPLMQRLPIPGVLDHMGHMPVAEGPDAQGRQALLHLLQAHGWWVKLSGAYRISDDWQAFRDVTAWAQTLANAAPDNILWGSDWPHVHISRMVDTGILRNQLAQWIPDETQRRKTLVDNPARLYGFDTAS
ncbi:amidohydrolase family protein [Pusillimonas sp. TS35]|uniref:amidohydrolase family protein n=1 Tax=Paracandidimonas lactea TaxID=2895524 RepID=UPI001370D2FB|nr:amidohydrolase family protein [Paracandidimonas lactea]MYN14417.1 amidohydrolase family protein [Pusillimonas sp. TS35]